MQQEMRIVHHKHLLLAHKEDLLDNYNEMLRLIDNETKQMIDL